MNCSDERVKKMKFVKRPTIGNLADPRLRYDYTNREIGTLPPDDRETFKWVSEVAYKNIHRIVARGYDTTELVEAGYGVCDVIFIDFQARIPLLEEKEVLEYVLILALEDGLSNPALIARLVVRGKAYVTQACGASVLAFGHSYASFDATGKMLDKYVAKVEKGMSLADAAKLCVKECKYEDHFGVSDHYVKDPAPRRLLDFAEKKLKGVRKLKYIPLMKEIVKVAKAEIGHVEADITGAMSAVMMELEFSPEAAWCIMGVTRAFATGAHAIEEMEREDLDVFGQTLTPKKWYDGPVDRPVPPVSERPKKGKQTQTPQEWKEWWTEMERLKGSAYSIGYVIEDPRKIGGSKKE
jgi:citrate synthase